MIDEPSHVSRFASINVPALTQTHDIVIRIVGMLLVPGSQPPFLFLFVNDIAEIFLDKSSLFDVFHGDQSPALTLLSLGLALFDVLVEKV